MRRNAHSYLVGGLIVGCVAVADAPAAPAVKSYTLANLSSTVSNSNQCASFLAQLRQLSRQPVKLQFTQVNENELSATDQSGQVTKYVHTTISQAVDGPLANRYNLGSFEFKGKRVEFVTKIAGNVDNPKHQYVYPAILSSHDGHCTYTALIKPSRDTVEAFKQSIRSGDVHKKTDLTK